MICDMLKFVVQEHQASTDHFEGEIPERHYGARTTGKYNLIRFVRGRPGDGLFIQVMILSLK